MGFMDFILIKYNGNYKMEKFVIYIFKKNLIYYFYVYKIEIKFIFVMILDVLIDIYFKLFYVLYNEFRCNFI